MFQFIFDQKTLNKIKEIKKYAENNLVPECVLIEMGNYGQPNYKGPLPAGINPENTLKLYDTTNTFYYTVAFSIEEMSSYWIRHFSTSNSLQEPCSKDIFYVLPHFGFKSIKKEDLIIQFESPVTHILEPVNYSWKEILETRSLKNFPT